MLLNKVIVLHSYKIRFVLDASGIVPVVQHCGNGVHPGLAQGLASSEAPLVISDSAQTTVASNPVLTCVMSTCMDYNGIIFNCNSAHVMHAHKPYGTIPEVLCKHFQ